MKRIILSLIAITSLTFMACSDDDDAVVVFSPEAGTITGGPFIFAIDGTADNVSGIGFDDSVTRIGDNSAWVITDDSEDPIILGTPADLAALEAVNFDGTGSGVCQIWYLRYNGTLPTITAGTTAVSALSSTSGLTFDLSNAITVTRIDAGTITGGPFDFTVDGTPDMVSGIGFMDSSVLFGTNNTWVVTDDSTDPVILATPADLAALEAIDFDNAGAGNCLIWYMRYEGTLPEINNGTTTVGAIQISDVVFDLSNSILVERN